MKTLRYSLAILLCALLSACGGGSSTGTGQTAQQAADAGSGNSGESTLERRIVVVGDSIGIGFNASFAFPDLLESLTGIEVVNASRGGSSAEMGASAVSSLIIRFRPQWIVILLGTNNAGGAGGGPSGAVNSLRFAAAVAIDSGVIPVIGTLPPITNDPEENNNVRFINSGIFGISGARIARINSAIPPSLVPDGTHPNDRGQEIIARLFAEQIF